MPPAIPAWSSALAKVDRSKPPTRILPTDGRYVFPEPGLFCSGTRQKQYFATWDAIRELCVYRVYLSTSDAQPLANQNWRDILGGNLQGEANDVQTRAAKRSEVSLQVLGGACESLGISLTDVPPPLDNLNPSVAMRTICELCELNFRFELLALDGRMSKDIDAQQERQHLLLDCFPGAKVMGVSRVNLLDIDRDTG